MGRSVGAYSGVLLSLQELKPLFRSRRLAIAFATKLLESRRRITRNDRLVVKRVWDHVAPNVCEDRGSLKQRLGDVATGEDLYACLVDCVYADQCGEVSKYGNTYFEKEYPIRHTWNDYIRWYNACAKTNLPRIAEIVTFGSGRNCGWVVGDYGHPFMKYAPDTIFSERLTGRGMALAAFLGARPSLLSWSDVSE